MRQAENLTNGYTYPEEIRRSDCRTMTQKIRNTHNNHHLVQPPEEIRVPPDPPLSNPQLPTIFNLQRAVTTIIFTPRGHHTPRTTPGAHRYSKDLGVVRSVDVLSKSTPFLNPA
jgi:hypothetical protein